VREAEAVLGRLRFVGANFESSGSCFDIGFVDQTPRRPTERSCVVMSAARVRQRLPVSGNPQAEAVFISTKSRIGIGPVQGIAMSICDRAQKNPRQDLNWGADRNRYWVRGYVRHPARSTELQLSRRQRNHVHVHSSS